MLCYLLLSLNFHKVTTILFNKSSMCFGGFSINPQTKKLSSG